MDEAFFVLLGLGLAVYLLVVPALGLAAFLRIEGLNRELAELRRMLAALQAAPLQPPAPAAEVAAEAPPEAAAEPAAAPEAVLPPDVELPPDADLPPADAAAPAGTAAPPASGGFERKLAGKGLVWLGGGTLALGGAFLVRYSIEQDLIGPGMRFALGLLLAAGLLAGAEWLRRRPTGRTVPGLPAAQVPLALAGAGIFIAFASVYAAYGLYDMLGPTTAFLGLALVAAAALGMSLLQGPWLALLGLLGGYLTPLLVASERPAAEPLFLYLAVLSGAVFGLARVFRWWPLGWAGLAGAALWALLWYAAAWSDGDGAVLALYLAALFAAAWFGRPRRTDEALAPAPADVLFLCAAGTVAVLLYILLRLDGYGTAGLLALVLFAAATLALARREAVLDPASAIGAAAVVAAYATWHLPAVLPDPYAELLVEWQSHIYGPRPLLPPELEPFVGWGLAFAALYGGFGYRALWGARRPWLWAAWSAAVPLALLALCYWRLARFEVALSWAAVALALAAVLTVAAERLARRRDEPWVAPPLGAYAAGIAAALALAFVMVLREAWLTVALSLELPALAWIALRLGLPGLRPVALAVAGVVMVRLLLNWELLDYPIGGPPLLNWIAYGYGIPCLAFLWSARAFRRQADDLLVAVLEAGALAFAVMLVTLELRHLAAPGPLDRATYPLLERALQALAWLAMGTVLYLRGPDRPVARWGARLLCGGAGLAIVFGQVLGANPLWSAEPVGEWPLANLLTLAYAAPAALAALLAWDADRRGERRIAVVAFAFVPVLLFVDLSLEVRRAFHGSVLAYGVTTDAEWYAYSLAWLLFAGLLLGLGLRLGIAALRYASLALVLLTIAKVFLFDMSALSGLYRALSFMGLGASLLAIVWLYARFVFPQRTAPAGGAGEGG